MAQKFYAIGWADAMTRDLKPELKQFLFDRMGTPEVVLAHAALACVGVKETKPNGGPLVELFQSTVGDARGESWCLSFVQSMIAYVEEMTGAKSPLNATEWVAELVKGNDHPALWRSEPRQGLLAVWLDQASLRGHIGIVAAPPSVAGWFYTVEGNTVARLGSQREGDGVYVRERFTGPLGSMAFKGFLRAF